MIAGLGKLFTNDEKLRLNWAGLFLNAAPKRNRGDVFPVLGLLTAWVLLKPEKSDLNALGVFLACEVPKERELPEKSDLNLVAVVLAGEGPKERELPV